MNLFVKQALQTLTSSVYQVGFHCRYHGQQFNVGETWPAIDGCNNCSCHAGDLAVRMTCTEIPCGQAGQCMYHGKPYKVGESFPSVDKCNTCFCGQDGSIGCTEKLCLLNENGNPSSSEVRASKRSSVWQRGFHCRYDNKIHQLGETWTATDGCNTCSCHAGDLMVRLVCTENDCVKVDQCVYDGQSYKYGESFPSSDKCNTCTCSTTGVVACTEKLCLLNPNRKKRNVASLYCIYNGKSYRTGESFPDVDNCNRCHCGEGGAVSCTEKACLGR